MRRCELWITKSGRPELSEKSAVYEDRVCEKHFEPHMFLNDYRNRLQPSAIPVLHLDAASLPSSLTITKVSNNTTTLTAPGDHRRSRPKLSEPRPVPDLELIRTVSKYLQKCSHKKLQRN